MLKILQASLQQYVNHEFPDVQAGFRSNDWGTLNYLWQKFVNHVTLDVMAQFGPKACLEPETVH